MLKYAYKSFFYLQNAYKNYNKEARKMEGFEGWGPHPSQISFPKFKTSKVIEYCLTVKNLFVRSVTRLNV